MQNRIKRRWDFFTMDEIKEVHAKTTTESVWNDALNHPMLVTDERLGGTQMTFEFDDFTIEYEFADERHLHWKSGDHESDEIYNVSPAPGYDNILFLHHYRSGYELPKCTDIIFNLDTGYAVFIDATVGVPECPRETFHEIYFGNIQGVEAPEGAVKPDFTSDLLGKAYYWRHPKEPKGIKYMFPCQQYYSYFMRFTKFDEVWMATNPADYIKIDENLYLLIIVEERQTGIQLCMLMNFDLLRDCQSGFGIGNPLNFTARLETFQRSGRVGEEAPFVTDLREDIPVSM